MRDASFAMRSVLVYSATANDLGLYVIKVNSELVKGKSFKIWQKQGKVKSANRTVKITE